MDIRREPDFSRSLTKFLQRGEAAVDLGVVKIAEHLVTTARFGARSLLVEERAVWLWRHLQRALPDALSCVLMPDHVHIVAPPGCRDRLRRVLAGFTARFGVRFDVLEPEPGNSAAIVGRMIRYGLLNPVRARLVEDAWAWRWSTLRDLGEACHPVWTSLDRIAAALELPPDVTLRSLTTIAGKRHAPPVREPVLTATTTAIHESIRAALRITKEQATRSRAARHLFVQAAHAIAPTSAQRLADELGCSVRTVVRARAARHPALDAVLTASPTRVSIPRPTQAAMSASPREHRRAVVHARAIRTHRTTVTRPFCLRSRHRAPSTEQTPQRRRVRGWLGQLRSAFLDPPAKNERFDQRVLVRWAVGPILGVVGSGHHRTIADRGVCTRSAQGG